MSPDGPTGSPLCIYEEVGLKGKAENGNDLYEKIYLMSAGFIEPFCVYLFS